MSIMKVGDVHLGKNLNLGKVSLDNNSRLEDQFKLLDWVLTQAKNNSVTDIIFTGDIFEDPSPEIIILRMLATWIKKATDQGFILHFVEGNHDFIRMNDSYISSLDIFKELHLNNVHFYREFTNKIIDNYNIIFAPFRDRKSLYCDDQNSALEKIQDLMLEKKSNSLKNILIGHLTIKGSIPIGDEIDDLTNEIFIPSTFFKNFEYTWLGHIHKFQVFHENPTVAHLGSLDISNFGEKDQDKFIVIFDTKLDTYKYISVPVRKYRTIEIDIPADTVDTTKYVLDQISKESVTNEVIRVEIKHSSSSNASSKKKEIEAALKEKSVFYVNSIVESKKIELVKKKSDVVIKDKTNISEALNTYAEKAEFVPENLTDNFLDIARRIARENK